MCTCTAVGAILMCLVHMSSGAGDWRAMSNMTSSHVSFHPFVMRATCLPVVCSTRGAQSARVLLERESGRLGSGDRSHFYAWSRLASAYKIRGATSAATILYVSAMERPRGLGEGSAHPLVRVCALTCMLQHPRMGDVAAGLGSAARLRQASTHANTTTI